MGEALLVAMSMDEVTAVIVPIVREFPNVFPNDLPGLPLDWEIEFKNDVLPCIEAIAKAPYRMAAIQLSKLKVQLQELLGKGFIRPSILLKGALVLFMKKKDGCMQLYIDC